MSQVRIQGIFPQQLDLINNTLQFAYCYYADV